MELRHTEGKWQWEVSPSDTNFYGKVFSEDAETDICEIYDWDNDTEAQANLNLIAAAPDLLNALLFLSEKIQKAAKENANYCIETEDVDIMDKAIYKVISS